MAINKFAQAAAQSVSKKGAKVAASVYKPGFQSSTAGVLRGVGKNLKSVGAWGPGSGDYLQAGVKGALTWGAVGGVSEAVQGGSFFEGAKGNLLGGAALGAAGRAVNIGTTGHQWQRSSVGDMWGGFKRMTRNQSGVVRNGVSAKNIKNMTKSVPMSAQQAKAIRNNSKVAKTVRTIGQNAKDAKTAKDYVTQYVK